MPALDPTVIIDVAARDFRAMPVLAGEGRLYVNLYQTKIGINADADTDLDMAAKNAAGDLYGSYLGTVMLTGLKAEPRMLDLTRHGLWLAEREATP